MQEDNIQGRRTKPLLLGNHLPPSICRRAPFPYRREGRRIFKRNISFTGQPRASLRGALAWLQFSFLGDPKGQYVEPANNTLAFASPVEGGPLFLPSIERLQTLYPGAYARGTTSNLEGSEMLEDLNVKVSARTHPRGGTRLHLTEPRRLLELRSSG